MTPDEKAMSVWREALAAYDREQYGNHAAAAVIRKAIDEAVAERGAETPSRDAIRAEMLAEVVEFMRTNEPDEEAAGCPATWGDFLQILQAEFGRP